MSVRIPIYYSTELKDQFGNLVYAETSRPHIIKRLDLGIIYIDFDLYPVLRFYDKMRGKWCFSHRGKPCPPGFREGLINKVNIQFLLTGGLIWLRHRNQLRNTM